MVPLFPIRFKDTWTNWYEPPPEDPRDARIAALLAENADLPDQPRRPDGTLAPTKALATNPFRSHEPPKRQIGT
jgi:hypothetical protein